MASVGAGFVFTHARRASEAMAMETMRNALLERGRSDKSVLREEAASRGKHKKTSQEDARALRLRPRAGSVDAPDVIRKSVKPASRWMIHPRASWKVVWNYAILVLLLYNAVMVPYSIAFMVYQKCEEVHASSPLVYAACVPEPIKVVDIVVDICFWVDMVLCFCTGHTDSREKVSMSASVVVHHYLRSWFLVDLFSVIPFDDIAVATVTTVLTAQTGLKYQLFRLPRLLRVGRLFKNLSSLAAADISRIVKLTLMFLLLAHWAACLFYFLGRWQVEFVCPSPFSGNLSWIQAFPGKGFSYASTADVRTKYTASLFWAMTAMTSVGYGDIVPLSNVERGFACVVELLGAISTALVFGNVALLVQGFEGVRARYRERVAQLNEFIEQHELPAPLAARIRGATDYLWAAHAGLDASSVLQELPAGLRAEMLTHVQAGVVQGASLFRHCDPALVSAIVLRLRPCVVLKGDSVFNAGEPGKDLFFIGKGTVQLTLHADPAARGAVVVLQPGDFFGESEAFLDVARRNASALALTSCDLFSISRHELDEALIEFPECLELVHAAAAQRRRELLDRISASLPYDETDESAAAGKLLPKKMAPASAEAAAGLSDKGDAQLLTDAAGAEETMPMLPAEGSSMADAERVLDELLAWQSRQTKELHAKLSQLEAAQAAVTQKLALLTEAQAGRGGGVPRGSSQRSLPSSVSGRISAGGSEGDTWRSRGSAAAPTRRLWNMFSRRLPAEDDLDFGQAVEMGSSTAGAHV